MVCGFDGEGTLPVAPGADEAGSGGPGAEAGRDVDVDALWLDDAGSSVLLDSAGALPEEAVDAGAVDAGPDGSCPPSRYRCPATDTCVTVCGGCPGTNFRCAATSTCVATCGTCAGRNYECAACSAFGTTLTKLTCEPSAATCYVDGNAHCDCGALGGCYSAQQVCYYRGFLSGYECRGCGESGTDKQDCVGSPSRKCKAATPLCE